MTVKQLAEALGYEDYRALLNLVKRNSAEFKDKRTAFKLKRVESGRSVSREMMILNYEGVILASMLSTALVRIDCPIRTAKTKSRVPISLNRTLP